jgi:uncharacterized hydrophobic protein (TIGR00271 family)
MPTTSSPIETIWQQFRQSLSSPPEADAIAAVEELIPQGAEFWPYIRRFTMLIVLSAGIAAFGLLSDSAAVVIGAMLVAPLMTPITAAGAATVMARNFRLLQSVAIIAWGTVGAIAVGWATAWIAGTTAVSPQDLPGEIQARTFPGLLDLGVAITAGAAAGYILPRRSTTSALPGVGIAVALVPPLATVGITFEVGFHEQSQNALLLFATNLAAIVFAVSVMLIADGFRPLERAGQSLARRLTITVAAVAVVAIPLTIHTRATLEDVRLRRAVVAAVQEWDDTARIVEMQADAASGRGTVELLISGPNSAQPSWRLAEGIESRFAGPVDLRLLYERDDLFRVSVR